MAKVVAAYGVPHTPVFPAMVAAQGPDSETAQLYDRLRRHLEAASPDVILIFDSDHINTFFLDNMPTFAVGLAARTWGPNDATAGLPYRELRVHRELASAIHTHGIANGFDLSQAQKFSVDHSVLVPLHFLMPDRDIPIVPFFINGLVSPLPTARRCWDLGLVVRQVLESLSDDLRVAVVASGSFSLEVGGPRVDCGKNFAVPDKAWAAHVVDSLMRGDAETLVEQASWRRLYDAGNVGGELLNWLAVAGVVKGAAPDFCTPQEQFGHAYAAWSLGRS